MMKIAVIQMCSVLDPDVNLRKISDLIREAKQNQAEAIFLPEAFYSMSDGLKPTPFLVEMGNTHYENISSLARDHEVYLLGGSAATLHENNIFNRSYNFGPDGKLLGIYDKNNLFKINLSSSLTSTIIDEGKVYTAGDKLQMLEIGQFKIGLSICFDLRFPELFRKYSFNGANILSISSAFTVPTGKAHWHTLLRARAIENQCYVIASGQWGEHNKRLSSYGHSLIIDPWGEIIKDAGEGEKIITAEIDLEKINTVRSRMSVLRNPTSYM